MSDLRRIFWLFLLGSSLATSAEAHDFWMEASAWHPVKDDIVAFVIRVGEGFKGEELVRHPKLMRSFHIYDVDKSEIQPSDVAGRLGTSPAGYIKFDGSGSKIIAYESTLVSLDLPFEKFRSYVIAQGPTLLAKSLDKMQGPSVSDDFTRHTKLLLFAEGRGRRVLDRRIGQELELVLAKSEAMPSAEARFHFEWQLLFQGRVVGDQTVSLLRFNGAGVEEKTAVTDSEGRVVFDDIPGGILMVRTVYVLPIAGRMHAWRSYWATETLHW